MSPYPPRPANGPLIDVLHADDTLIVLNKPAGLLSVPGKTEPDCLETRVRAEFADAETVHRLDMATSGVIVMARGKGNLAALQQQFEKRRVQKTYIAIVAGSPAGDAGTVDAPLRCDWPNRPLQMICRVDGRPALTHWHVLDRQDGRTRLMLTPITGRSHQLRVHLASIGHPILGDQWYADEASAALAPRLLLHAERLTLTHPKTGERMTFVAETPF